MLAEKLLSCKSDCTKRAVNVFIRRLRAVKNTSQLSSFLITAGSSVFKTSGAFRRKIVCQPTSIARRQDGQPRGKASVMRGRSTKRKRNLSKSIELNVPNGKVH